MRRLLIPLLVAGMLLAGTAAALAYSSVISDWTITGGDGIENSPCTQIVGDVCRGWLMGAWIPPTPATMAVTQTFFVSNEVLTYTLLYTIPFRPGGINSITVTTPCGSKAIEYNPPRVAATTIISCTSSQPPGKMEFIYDGATGRFELRDVSLSVDGGPPAYPFQSYIPLLYQAGMPPPSRPASPPDRPSPPPFYWPSWRY